MKMYIDIYSTSEAHKKYLLFIKYNNNGDDNMALPFDDDNESATIEQEVG